MGEFTIKLLQDDDGRLVNDFVSARPHSSFLQSFEWGQFQKAVGRKAMRLGVFEAGKNQLAGSALLIKHTLPFGKYYWYCPRGPVLAGTDAMEAIARYVPKHGGVFLRVDPLDDAVVAAGGSPRSTVQPSNTRVLDIMKDEEALLLGMHPKTRYNIRLAQKKGVIARCFEKPSSERIFECINLIAATSARHGIKAHPRFYYETMLRALCATASDGLYANVFTAYFQNKPLASNIVLFFGDTATYLHGGSEAEHKNVMAPYLLQWEAIREAKRRGFRFYDFWGVAPPGAERHTWQGITRFKNGFGGEIISYPSGREVPMGRFWYGLFCIVKKIVLK